MAEALPDNDADIDETKVDIAARFLSNSNVMETEIENRESFLKNKGLNEAEIKLAFERAAELKNIESKDESWSIFDYLKGIVLASGILSAANYAYKAYVLPYATRELKDDARMEILVESFQDVKDDIKQHTYELTGTLKQMQVLMEENQKSLVSINAVLNKEKEPRTTSGSSSDVSGTAAAELKSEISMIKSMMLSKEQFRATPFTSLKPKTNEIPAWQRIADEMAAEKDADVEAGGSVTVESVTVESAVESVPHGSVIDSVCVASDNKSNEHEVDSETASILTQQTESAINTSAETVAATAESLVTTNSTEDLTLPEVSEALSAVDQPVTAPVEEPAVEPDSQVEQLLAPQDVEADDEPVATVTSEINGVLYEMVTKTDTTSVENEDLQNEDENDAPVVESDDIS